MKKLLLLLAVITAVSFVSCTSEDDKMHTVAINAIKPFLNDSTATDNIEFGKTDSLFDTYRDTPEGQKEYERINKLHDRMTDPFIYFNKYETQETAHELDSLTKDFKSKSKNYKGKHIGWKFDMYYNGSDKNGNPVKDTLNIHMNLEGTKAVKLVEHNVSVRLDDDVEKTLYMMMK